MPKGKKVVPVQTQVNECLDSLEFKPIGEYFEKDVEKTVYYCAGYLGHAGATAASKRSTNLGKCIGAATTHVATTEEAAAIVKQGLPEGLASLVDKCAVHGCLSYPNIRFYSLIAKIEYCYSKLATPYNLMLFGGRVLATICDCMVNHEVLSEHFASLYEHNSGYDKQTI
jgi:hypothetical protein